MNVCTLSSLTLLSDPIEYHISQTGEPYYAFTAKDIHDGIFSLLAFDGEGDYTPYKRVKSLKLKKGICITVQCSISMVKSNVYAVSQQKHDFIYQPRFKVLAIEYAVPYGYSPNKAGLKQFEQIKK